VNDERRRFILSRNKDKIRELEPLTPWQNLTYVGGMYSGTTVCGVRKLKNILMNKRA
jgi:hypothetical protein